MSPFNPTPSNSGYVDLQVNGYAGVDFNGDNLTVDAMHGVCQRMRDEGAAGFLPTVITDEVDVMAARLARLADVRRADPLAREMILGVHIEGPFISAAPGNVGAHPQAAVRPANLAQMERLLEAADGLTRIVTLAPEHDEGLNVTRYLADHGITVAAGHCDPSLEQLQAAIDAGLSMFTHLGNGCPAKLNRHDNIIQRTLSLSDQLWISFIADGHHVPFPALGNYLRSARIERCVIVSDAISAAGLGPGRYQVGNQSVEVGEDLVPRSADGTHFVGSATTIPKMMENLRRDLRLSQDEIQQLTSIGPRRILGSDQMI
ncbi:MAG: N-acetylglucosamine-6-phosphate deacetylase [Planctomycetes bacterium]|nr:N-acetylglucosamine-6-phosphate deacetylase [Planctomycetota bacterium]